MGVPELIIMSGAILSIIGLIMLVKKKYMPSIIFGAFGLVASIIILTMMSKSNRSGDDMLIVYLFIFIGLGLGVIDSVMGIIKLTKKT